MDVSTLITQLNLSNGILKKNCEGFTQEDSMKAPAGGGNCANWVVGHVVKARNRVVELLTGEPAFNATELSAYEHAPLESGADAIPFSELLTRFDSLQGAMENGIRGITPERAAEKAPFSPTNNPDETVGSLLATFLFHETYHGGQLAILRRTLGKPGVTPGPRQAA